MYRYSSKCHVSFFAVYLSFLYHFRMYLLLNEKHLGNRCFYMMPSSRKTGTSIRRKASVKRLDALALSIFFATTFASSSPFCWDFPYFWLKLVSAPSLIYTAKTTFLSSAQSQPRSRHPKTLSHRLHSAHRCYRRLPSHPSPDAGDTSKSFCKDSGCFLC